MRARNLKPGFFQNEQLAELPIEARLLFAGLWCMADREGRLEDRPKRIKMAIFPADMIDVEPLLRGLADQKLIVRYLVGGVAYLWIPRFMEHQNPHPHERASVIPPCPAEQMFHDEPKAVTCNDMSRQSNTLVLSSRADSLNPESSISDRERDRFAEFWLAYPRKLQKAAAKRTWARKKLDSQADHILAHLAERVRSDAQWLRDGGQFIPYPATWLNADGWLDEYTRATERGFVC